jgi:hypothetical protein
MTRGRPASRGTVPRVRVRQAPIGGCVLVISLALGQVAIEPARAARGHYAFGGFAGYLWLNHVSSIAASWTVPGIARGSRVGVAATWIGAQASSPAAFIQLGTIELGAWPRRRSHPVARYTAFWSDTQHHYRAQRLLEVRAGDRISASLTLAEGRWTLAIADRTSGARRSFSTTEEAGAAFDQGEWTREDPTNGETHEHVPYPRLARVRFDGMRLDGRLPGYGALYSVWMSAWTRGAPASCVPRGGRRRPRTACAASWGSPSWRRPPPAAVPARAGRPARRRWRG